MSKIYTIICEWDIGQDGQFFTSIDDAFDYVEKVWKDLDMEEEVGYSSDEAYDNGLLVVTDVELN